MRGKYFFRLMLLICLLAAATLGCKLIENVRSTIRGVRTVAAVATDIGGIITQIPPGMGETAIAVMPTMQSAITEIAPTFEAIATQIYTSPSKAPPDIPIMAGETSQFVGTAQLIQYTTTEDFNKAVEFYKTEMPKKGWTLIDSGTGSGSGIPGIPGMSNTELKFQMGNRKATVMITELPVLNTSIVINIEE